MSRLRSSYSLRFASGRTKGASASSSSARSRSSLGRPPGFGSRCSARSISVSVFRYCGTDEFVETTMPSATRVAHAGNGRGEPSTPTTHMRQPPYGSSLSSWQRVGMKTPWRAAAWTRSSPSGALARRPSSVKLTIVLTVCSSYCGLTQRFEEIRPVAERISHREGRPLPKPADRGCRHRVEPLLRPLACHRRPAALELLDEMMHAAVSDPARRALLARLLGEEPHRLGEEPERRVRRREDLQRGGAGAGIPLAQALAGERHVEGIGREDPAGRAAEHDRADLPGRAARVVVDQLSRRYLEGRLVAAGGGDRAGDGPEPHLRP